MIAIMEELIRESAFSTRFDIKETIEKRVQYIFTTICEHKQRDMRSTENERVLSKDSHRRDTRWSSRNIFKRIGFGANIYR